MVLSAALALAEETYSSIDRPGSGAETLAPGLLRFEEADLTQVLNTYRELSKRTIVRSSALPHAKISLETQTPLTRIEALQALDTVLAQNGIVMIPQGTKFVKAVARQVAPQETPPIVNLPREQLPESSTYVTYIVEVKHKTPKDIAAGLQPFAALPNSILGIDSAHLIVLRDFSSNVRRMLEILERIDKESPAEKPEPKKQRKRSRALPKQ
jgi:type II secretory pathway component GspD/PulD (secretin)